MLAIDDFVSEVKKQYMQWWTAVAKLRILQRQDSIYSRFNVAVQKQMESGEISRLAGLMTGSKAFRVQNQLKDALSNVRMAEEELKLLLFTDSAFTAPSGSPQKMILPAGGGKDPDLNPHVKILSDHAGLKQSILQTESWKAVPSLSFGWFTQSIDMIGNYTGFQYGISIPIWFWVPAGRIQAARVERDMANNEYEYGRRDFINHIAQLHRLLEKQRNNLEYYERSGLKQSDLMIETAEKSYRAGEIDYFEYILSLSEAFSLSVEYLDELARYNETVIDISNLIEH